MRHLRLASVALALVACTTPAPVEPGTDAGVGPGTDTGVDPTVDAPPGFPGGEEFTLTFPTVNIAVGEENTQCVILRLGNDHPIHVGEIQNMLSTASHHFIVYRTAETVEQPVPFDCTPFLDTLDPENGSPLMITQVADETLTLPTGVAFELPADVLIRLEMHYVNTGVSGGPIDASATATFRTIADADFTDAADFLFIGTPDISIPAHSTATVGPVFFNFPAELDTSEPLNFFAITGHTHHFGTNVLISTAENATDPGTSIYDVPAWSWEEPETSRFPTPFNVPAGGGFTFSCDYDNTSDSTVGFGESTDQEMCFFWAYYYPSIGGGRVCVHTERTGSGLDLCCPGSSLCSLIGSML